MFSIEALVADCRKVLSRASAGAEVKEIVQRAVSRPADVERALGTPRRAEIVTLHRAQDLTVLNVIWAPGMSIYPHDHRMWAVIGLYTGTEDNYFFKRINTKIERASLKRLETSDASLLGEQTIHSVTNPLGRFTGAIHVYGGDFFAVPRSEFDADTLEERPYDIEKAKRTFLEANKNIPA